MLHLEMYGSMIGFPSYLVKAIQVYIAGPLYHWYLTLFYLKVTNGVH